MMRHGHADALPRACKRQSAYFQKWKDWIQPVCLECCDKHDNAKPWWVTSTYCMNEYSERYRIVPQIRREEGGFAVLGPAAGLNVVYVLR